MGITRVGDIVQVTGLQTKPELNGRIGKVIEARNENGRFAIDVDFHITDSTSEKVLVKPDNLSAVE